MSRLSLGGCTYSNWAVNGRDNRRALSTDVNCFWNHFKEIDGATGTSGRIVGCETGINPELAGMIEDVTDRKRQTNFYELGRMRVALLNKLRETPIQIISLFAASDSDDSAVPANQFGAFSDRLGTANDQTFSAEIPFAIQAGWLPSAPYSGPDYILADNEELPPLA